jgi:hypothetical protein
MTMECNQIMCHNDAVAILEVRFVVNGKTFTYEYGYCEQDLPWFKEKFEDHHGYIVTERKL